MQSSKLQEANRNAIDTCRGTHKEETLKELETEWWQLFWDRIPGLRQAKRHIDISIEKDQNVF